MLAFLDRSIETELKNIKTQSCLCDACCIESIRLTGTLKVLSGAKSCCSILCWLCLPPSFAVFRSMLIYRDQSIKCRALTKNAASHPQSSLFTTCCFVFEFQSISLILSFFSLLDHSVHSSHPFTALVIRVMWETLFLQEQEEIEREGTKTEFERDKQLLATHCTDWLAACLDTQFIPRMSMGSHKSHCLLGLAWALLPCLLASSDIWRFGREKRNKKKAEKEGKEKDRMEEACLVPYLPRPEGNS